MAELVVDGVRLVYDVHGEGPPVLLIAGTGMPAAMWGMTATPPLLEAGYQVITFVPTSSAPRCSWRSCSRAGPPRHRRCSPR